MISRTRLSRRITSCLSVPVLWAGASSSIGCAGAPPRAGVSDLTPYTALHVRVAELADDPDKPLSTAANMHRFFATPQATYDAEHLRMDAMLENAQQLSAYAQAQRASLVADLEATLQGLPGGGSKGNGGAASTARGAAGQRSGGGAATGSAGAGGGVDTGTGKPGGSGSAADGGAAEGGSASGASTGTGAEGSTDTQAAISDTLKKLLDKQLEGVATDSPFDLLDRASDFYTAYSIKLLRARGDSRVENTGILVNYLKKEIEHPDPQHPGQTIRAPRDPEFASQNAGEANASRLVFLYIPVHVDTGTRPNTMVALRLTVTSATLRDGQPRAEPQSDWGSSQNAADLVKIVRVHPTRFYDIDSTLYGNELNQALSLSGKASAPLQVATLSGAVTATQSLDAEQRLKFLSRMGKQTSFCDAPNHTFGWNFYPTNVRVVTPNFFELVGDTLFGRPSQYKVRATLDGGARDCMVTLVVPNNLGSLQLRVQNLIAEVDPDGIPGSLQPLPLETGKSDMLTVSFPAYRSEELIASSAGVFSAYPTSFAAQRLRLTPPDNSSTGPATRPDPGSGR